MLFAIIAMYRITNSIIGSSLIAATIGVRQGSPTSCILFIIFVNDLIKIIKDNCGIDGFLGWLHILVLMDDTVLLSTTRGGMIQKLNLLDQFCNSHGMIVNSSKTKFFVINGNRQDEEQMVVGGFVVDTCEQYVYLGCIFTADGSVSSSIKAEAQSRICHVLKFVSFLNKNNDIPFKIKYQIFQLALMPALVYGSESWLNGDIKPMNKLYLWCIKQLLGVRKTTVTSLCLVELGCPEFRSLVAANQRKFFSQAWSERRGMIDDPLVHAVRIILDYNSPVSRYVHGLINNNVDDIGVSMEKMKTEVSTSQSNRVAMYRQINSELTVHAIYAENVSVDELERVNWTRMRLSSHSLAVEVGRWNRRGRGSLPMEERLCTCGQVQTEQHVIEVCPRTENIRRQWNVSSMINLLSERVDFRNVCHIVTKILNIYK